MEGGRSNERQSHITKLSTRRDDNPARSDSETTVQDAPGTSTRPLPEAGTDLWRD